MLLVTFNALAAWMGSTDYRDVLVVAAIVGFILTTIVSTFRVMTSGPVSFAAIPQQFLMLVLVFGLLVAPTSTVIVVDEMRSIAYGDRGRVFHGGSGDPIVGRVANVPSIFAALAHYSSLIGRETTDAFETLFSPAEEFNIGNGGLWVMGRALRGWVDVNKDSMTTDSYLLSDYFAFYRRCLFHAFNEGNLSFEDFNRGSPILRINQLFTDTPNIGSVGIRSGGGDGELTLFGCRAAWEGGATGDQTVAGRRTIGLRERIALYGLEKKSLLCRKLQQSGGGTFGRDRNTEAIDGSTPTRGNEATCGDDVFDTAIRQFAGLTGYASVEAAFQDSAFISIHNRYVSSSTLDPEHLGRGEFVARRSRDSGFLISGKMAADVLPLIRGILEVILVMLFPLAIVFCLVLGLEGVQHLRGFLIMIFWIHMWPPMFAVVNAVGNLIQEGAIEKITVLGGEAGTTLSLKTVGPLLDTIETQLAYSQWMIVLVPMLAYFIVKGGDFVGVTLANRFLQPSESAAASAGQSAAAENWSFNQENFRPMTRVGAAQIDSTNPHGGTTTSFEQPGGGWNPTAYTQAMNASAFQVNAAGSVSTGLTTALRASRGEESQTATDLSDSTRAAWTESANLGVSTGTTESWGKNFNEQQRSETSAAVARTEKWAQVIRDEHGLSEEDAARAVLDASLGGGAGSSFRPLAGDVGLVGHGISQSSDSYRETLSKQEGWDDSVARSDAETVARALAQSESLSYGESASKEERESAASSWDKSNAAALTHRDAVSKSEAIEESIRVNRENSTGWNVDIMKQISPEVIENLDKNRDNPAAQKAYLSELSNEIGGGVASNILREIESRGEGFDAENVVRQAYTNAQVVQDQREENDAGDKGAGIGLTGELASGRTAVAEKVETALENPPAQPDLNQEGKNRVEGGIPSDGEALRVLGAGNPADRVWDRTFSDDDTGPHYPATPGADADAEKKEAEERAKTNDSIIGA